MIFKVTTKDQWEEMTEDEEYNIKNGEPSNLAYTVMLYTRNARLVKEAMKWAKKALPYETIHFLDYDLKIERIE